MLFQRPQRRGYKNGVTEVFELEARIFFGPGTHETDWLGFDGARPSGRLDSRNENWPKWAALPLLDGEAA